MPDIKVTVLMPCYNAGDYIRQAVQSVLDQTFPDFELLIVNDGSTDNTVHILKSFADKRIVVIEQKRQGVAAALNNGLKFAHADLIARFDADDICLPDRLQKQYDFMITNPDYIVIGSAAEYIDDSGNPVFTHIPLAKSNREITGLAYDICPFIHASVFYKKSIIESIGYNIYAHSFEDHLLWLQLRGKGKMYNMTEPLLLVRLNPGSLTMDERKRSRAFRMIKDRVLKNKLISVYEGEQLSAIIRQESNQLKKTGAYHSLLAKKFLWNNYDPAKARANMKKAITLNKFDIKDYLILGISYLPKKMIHNLYSIFS
jgi:glycosyltransferase involved in cell wall biosynthesis